MKKILFLASCCFLLLANSGCVPLVVGATLGAVGGYAASKDTVQGDTDTPYDSIWQAAIAVSRIRGTIKQDNSEQGVIELSADSNKVWIRLFRLTQATTTIKVSARNRFHLPNISLAQDLFVKIIEQSKRQAP